MRKIVRAADGDDQRRDLFENQAAKMVVHRAIAAEDQRCVRLVGGIELVTGKDVDARQLEGPQVMIFSVRSQQSDGAHRATFAQDAQKAKPGLFALRFLRKLVSQR